MKQSQTFNKILAAAATDLSLLFQANYFARVKAVIAANTAKPYFGGAANEDGSSNALTVVLPAATTTLAEVTKDSCPTFDTDITAIDAPGRTLDFATLSMAATRVVGVTACKEDATAAAVIGVAEDESGMSIVKFASTVLFPVWPSLRPEPLDRMRLT